eukprot:scaffold2522_cov121-Isochrysis_galbana.AAC.5
MRRPTAATAARDYGLLVRTAILLRRCGSGALQEEAVGLGRSLARIVSCLKMSSAIIGSDVPLSNTCGRTGHNTGG